MKIKAILILIAVILAVPFAIGQAQEIDDLTELNNQIRREKFDLILPQAMRKNNIDMWIHVMRVAISDPFGAEDLGTTSGVIVFTDRGGDRIERALLGRRWGDRHRYQRGEDKSNLIEEYGAYDIIGDPVRVVQSVSSPMTEYDYRFKGLRKFVEERDPERIAVNYREKLATWPTSSGNPGNIGDRANDGISHIDYLLLAEELGKKYANRLVSSEYVMMHYNISPVPSEIELLKRMHRDEVKVAEKVFSKIVPGVTKTDEEGVTVFRRMRTGLSQRERSEGWENSVVQGGDIIASPSQGMYAYVLREGETEAPSEIKKLWAEYLKIENIFAETIKAGLTPREIIQAYKQKFTDAGIIVRDPQLHMVQPKNNFPVYSTGLDPEKTQLSIDLHGMGKGAREKKFDIYLGPRIGSYGPDWTHDIALSANHHFVLEYFFYMPSPSSKSGIEDEDQYLLFWAHEQAIATENGVEYLSPPQKDIYIIH